MKTLKTLAKLAALAALALTGFAVIHTILVASPLLGLAACVTIAVTSLYVAR